jgi:hypothetical protein
MASQPPVMQYSFDADWVINVLAGKRNAGDCNASHRAARHRWAQA